MGVWINNLSGNLGTCTKSVKVFCVPGVLLLGMHSKEILMRVMKTVLHRESL